ncbi:MAG: PaaI family thioesterase [Polyangiaceae bacterium]|nr:PaaI family thioesterase [Polyangiaceae bacterium]
MSSPSASSGWAPPAGPSLQDQYAAKSICFGCGPANAQGLHIKSYVEGDELVARFVPEPHHHAFPGVLNGGIIGALLDCHSNWAASHHLMKAMGADAPPCTVTADFHVKLKRPTPMGEVLLRARVTESQDDRAVVEATMEAGGKITATCTGTFVAVKEGHPAFHRW